MQAWKWKKEIDIANLLSVFEKFDDNGDGVLQFDEFEKLMKHFDKHLPMSRIADLFN